MKVNKGDKVRLTPDSNEIWEVIEANTYTKDSKLGAVRLKFNDIILDLFDVSDDSYFDIVDKAPQTNDEQSMCERLERLSRKIDVERARTNDTANFCWEMSENLYKKLIDEMKDIYKRWNEPYDYDRMVNQEAIVFGIPVMINRHHDDILRVWQEVKL